MQLRSVHVGERRNASALILNCLFQQPEPSLERRCLSCPKPTSRSTGTVSPARSSPSGATPTSPSTSTSVTSHGPSRSRWGLRDWIRVYGAALARCRVSLAYYHHPKHLFAEQVHPDGNHIKKNKNNAGAAIFVMQSSGWFQVHLIVITRLMSDG